MDPLQGYPIPPARPVVLIYNVLQYATKVVKIPDVLYNYYIRNDSATRNASANFKSLRSKVDAFEKAAMIAKIWGGNFQIRINNTLFSAIISYCAAMFSAKNYNKSTIYDMKIKLKFIRPLVVFKELPKGIKFRYVLLKLNPRLLYLIEAKRK